MRFIIIIIIPIALLAYIPVCISYIKNRKLKPKQENNSKKTRKTVLVAVTVIIVCITAGCLIANRVYHTCGDGVTWSLRGDVFTVKSSLSGGRIDEIKLDYNEKEYITEIIIEPGVETISFNAFEGFNNLQKVTIPNTVKLINEYAFNCCDYDFFYSVYFEGTEEEWNQIEIRERGNELFLQKIKDGCLDMDVWGYAGMENELSNVETSTTTLHTEPITTQASEPMTEEETVPEGYVAVTDTEGNIVEYIPELIELKFGSNSIPSNSANYMFTPSQDGYYKFESINTDGADFEAVLVDSGGEFLGSNDDSGDENNFLISYYLYEGEIYYLELYFASGSSDKYPTLNLDISLTTEEEVLGLEIFDLYYETEYFFFDTDTLYGDTSRSADETSWSESGMKDVDLFKVTDQTLWLGFEATSDEYGVRNIWYPIEMDDNFKYAYNLFLDYHENGLYFDTSDSLYNDSPKYSINFSHWTEASYKYPYTFVIRDNVLWLGFSMDHDSKGNITVWYPVSI